MALESGRRLGPYEIVAQIGAGGMGEVYKATDTRLNRTIAIKVLPEHLAGDPQRLARFQREAQTISSLNHPHICALHDVGEEGGTHFLVMEYVEGEALDQRLERGPVPLDDAIEYAKQIADALEKAHHQGIVHRDLKPANVMITKAGVKLLDFGLAKLTVAPESGSPLSQMKTQDSDLTAEGTIMGTFRYMAPEQVEGQEVDSRTDTYALCLVIYEMITGKRAIDGKSQASLIAAILKDKPTPITELQPITPPQLDRVVQTGLEKDPDKRWQSAREVKHALEWIGLERPAVQESAVSEDSGWLWKGIATAALVAAFLVTWVLWPTPAPPEMRVDIATPATLDPQSFALSPAGDTIVFAADDEGQPKLWLRAFGSGSDDAQPLAGTDGGSRPFWSPDGGSVGFFADGQLKTIRLDGGAPQALAPIVFAGGGTWGDGQILFSPGGGSTILRVSEAGGEIVPVVADPPVFNSAPQFLPDGRQFLFFNFGAGADPRGIYVGSIDSPDTLFLLDSEAPGAFHPEGYLLYVRQGTLWAQRFDPDRAEVLEVDAHRVAEGIVSASISASGAIAYRRGGTVGTELRWFNRAGEPLDVFASGFSVPDISRDGELVAALQGGDVWVMGSDLSQPRRVTFDARLDNSPVLSPDGSQVAFAAFRDVVEIHQVASNGAGAETGLLTDGGMPGEWLPAGGGILYSDVSGSNVDIRLLHLEGEGEVTDYLADPQRVETRGQISPNGRWIAYELETGGGAPTEVFVRPFPDAAGGGLWQVSTNGGRYVRWSPDGTELFYLTRTGALMAIPVDTTGPVFNFETAQPMFQTPIPPSGLDSTQTQYDVSPDGDFLITVPSSGGTNTPINLIFDWSPDAD